VKGATSFSPNAPASYTINNAYLHHEEKDKGSLAVGKLGPFEEFPCTVAPIIWIVLVVHTRLRICLRS
jgi:hypothetical protein